MFRYAFALIATIVLIGINMYVYKRFLAKVDVLSLHVKKIKWFMIIISACELLFFSFLRSGAMPVGWYYIFSSLIGISFMLFSVALVYDLIHLPLKKVSYDASRRVMIKTVFDVTMLLFALSYMLKGFINGFKEPSINEVYVKIRGLKEDMTVVQISDIHIGKSLGYAFMESIVKKINSLSPDIVVITGDLVDLKVEEIEHKLDSLRDIKSKYGVYFVSGNHEYFHGVAQIEEFLKTRGVQILDNEGVVINNELNLLGVSDLMGRRFDQNPPDLKNALRFANKNYPTILLAHQPKFAKEIVDENIDLILSGHTHAGQIFPFGLLVLLDQPYLHGLYQHNAKTQIYVSSGAGYWGPPIRVMAPSEIVKLRLKPDALF